MIILAIIFILTGGLDFISSLVNVAMVNSTANNIALQNTIQNTSPLLLVGFIVFAIISIIFSFIMIIANCRLAKTGSIGEGLKIGEILKDINSIGIGKFISWYILFVVVMFIISLILIIIGLIPIIGVIIVSIIGNSFIILFSSRVIGLLYSEI